MLIGSQNNNTAFISYQCKTFCLTKDLLPVWSWIEGEMDDHLAGDHWDPEAHQRKDVHMLQAA